VKFTGNGQKLFEQKIAVDIENRNPNDEPNGILYELVAESCIPGINTRSFESIFEEQLVLPSQHHSTNVTNVVKSNVFFVEERVFNFGTLVPSKVPEGIVEKIKIENSNKVTCNVKFDVRKKTPNAIEQFAFEVDPKEIKIPPHEYHYVKIIFKPTIMASYAGVFEAIV
jgi:hydrocephalus-inducing protein